MSSPTPFRAPNIPPQRLTAISRLGRYLRQAYNAKHSVLQYHRGSNALSSWQWPTYHGDRVAPAVLFGYCLEKSIPRPCCLCPLKDATKPAFVEAIFLQATEGIHAEEYVAKCVDNYCGYFVPVQRIYERGALNYASRGMPNHGGPSQGPAGTETNVPRIATPVVTTPPARPVSSNLQPAKRLKRSYALLDLDDVFAIPTFEPSNRRASETEILLRLDDYAQPGLYEAEFKALLGRMAKCSCGMIMAQRVFKEHRCALGMMRPLKKRKTQGVIIDLTQD